MEACLRPQVSCYLINDNHQAENERYWRNQKYNQKKGLYTTLYVCLCLCECVWVCICIGYICILLCEFV